MNTPIIFYSTDLQDIAKKERTIGCCIHLVCTRGKGSFQFDDRKVTFSEFVICSTYFVIYPLKKKCSIFAEIKKNGNEYTHHFLLY